MKKLFLKNVYLGLFQLAFITMTVCHLGVAQAASSKWQNHDWGSIQLVASKDPADGRLNGVIHVKLEKGWKTYWRSPGNSGIPPEFNFSNSSASMIEAVNFPTPSAISSNGETFYGYKSGDVLFPFSGMSISSNSDIKLDLLIGVCEEICIPATANLAIDSKAFNTSDPLAEQLYQQALASLPSDAGDMDGKITVKMDGQNAEVVINSELSPEQNKWVVLWVPGLFSSDPSPLTMANPGKINSTINLPKSLIEQLGKQDRWHYAVLTRKKKDGKIIDVIEGSVSTAK